MVGKTKNSINTLSPKSQGNHKIAYIQLHQPLHLGNVLQLRAYMVFINHLTSYFRMTSTCQNKTKQNIPRLVDICRSIPLLNKELPDLYFKTAQQCMFLLMRWPFSHQRNEKAQTQLELSVHCHSYHFSLILTSMHACTISLDSRALFAAMLSHNDALFYCCCGVCIVGEPLGHLEVTSFGVFSSNQFSRNPHSRGDPFLGPRTLK